MLEIYFLVIYLNLMSDNQMNDIGYFKNADFIEADIAAKILHELSQII